MSSGRLFHYVSRQRSRSRYITCSIYTLINMKFCDLTFHCLNMYICICIHSIMSKYLIYMRYARARANCEHLFLILTHSRFVQVIVLYSCCTFLISAPVSKGNEVIHLICVLLTNQALHLKSTYIVHKVSVMRAASCYIM